MADLNVGTRVTFRNVPTIPKAWIGLPGSIVSVVSGKPVRYAVKVDGREAPLDGFSEDELEIVER